MVNHLVEIPVLDRYNPPKPQLPGMKYNQKVKGGTELLYQSFCVGQLSVKERYLLGHRLVQINFYGVTFSGIA